VSSSAPSGTIENDEHSPDLDVASITLPRRCDCQIVRNGDEDAAMTTIAGRENPNRSLLPASRRNCRSPHRAALSNLTSVSLSDQGLVQVLEAAVTGLDLESRTY
jgi:hypothetical protein